MVWLIAGLPAAAVLAGLTTVMIASHHADQTVDESFHKEGLAVHIGEQPDTSHSRPAPASDPHPR